MTRGAPGRFSRGPLQSSGALFRNALAVSAAFVLAVLYSGSASADDLEQLLAASDLFARAPTEFRAELEVRPLGAGDGSGSPLEVYRKGPDRELVRFLAPKERGKFLLRRGDDLFFLAPGSRNPVALAPSYRVYGAAIQDLLGLDLARDYRIEKSAEANGVVTFDLVATSPRAATPRLRWVVARATKRPLRADLQSSAGKTLRVLEFNSWRDAARGVPELLVVKDVVGGGTPIEARFLAFEPQPIDDQLFDLQSSAARAALR